MILTCSRFVFKQMRILIRIIVMDKHSIIQKSNHSHISSKIIISQYLHDLFSYGIMDEGPFNPMAL